jgi:DNA-directed RNA polymerase specialized sigma24 family protein
MELSIKGYTQSEIAELLKVGIATVNRDLHAMRREFYRNKEELVDLIREEHLKTLHAMNQTDDF